MPKDIRWIHTITNADMKGINRTAILEIIRRESPISRVAIAESLDVSLPTVMRIVEELSGEGLVRSSANKEWSGGRKRALIEFSGEDHLVIGMDLGGTKIYGAVTDLCGNVLHEIQVVHHDTRDEDSFKLVVDTLQELIQFAQKTGYPIQGIGLGVPGVTHPDGIVEFAPSLNWTKFPLKGRLQEYFNLPIVIENDVNLAALGELWFGAERHLDSLVLITVGTGIGSGIIINGMVYPGMHDMAGEIGYLLPDRTHLGQNYSGFGALETLASGSGIADRARRILKDRWPADQLTALTAEDVFNSARLHEPWAEEVLAETVDYLALLIASITLCFDPEIILLGGGVSKSADLLIEPILKRLKNSIPILPKLAPSSLGYRAAVYGSIVKLLRMASSYYWLQKYS
jgi:glucokinase